LHTSLSIKEEIEEMSVILGAPIDRYAKKVPELAEIWLSPEGVGKFRYIHRVEVANAHVQAKQGLISNAAAKAVARSNYDPDEIIRRGGHDINAFIDICRESMPPEHRGAFHRGLTSFDVQDTGFALMYRESADLMLNELVILAVGLQQLAGKHKETLMMGRTHGIHAKPITFAFKVLNWQDFVLRARERLIWARDAISVGKLSGAVGVYTLPPEIEKEVCRQLGLRPAKISTQILPRDLHADFFHALTTAASACENIANDIRNYQRTDLWEMAEPFPAGMKGSSAMPHKRNPEKCEQIVGIARLVRNDMGVIYENIVTGHERTLEQSSPERLCHPEMVVLTGYLVHSLSEIILGLEVFPDRMLANMNRTGGAIYSESVKVLLQDKGIDPELVYRAIQEAAFKAMAGEGDLKSNLLANPEIGPNLTPGDLDAVMDPWLEVVHRDEIYARFGL
jgi:adenylosuccinate lyase